jgi:ubiquinone/menaquinone biosynthesis C-methylase UbiE
MEHHPIYVEYPEYYDYAHDKKEDIPFFLEYARKCGGPVLELACGTGRLLVPMAQEGRAITGLDFAPGMLAVCRERVERLGLSDHVTLVQADMADFNLAEKQFAFAYVPLRSFSHLFAQPQQLACLRRTYEHLKIGGIFIVVAFALNFSAITEDKENTVRFTREFELPEGRRVVQTTRFLRYDPGEQMLYFEFAFVEHDAAGRIVRERTVPMDMRYTSRNELQLLMERVGFEVFNVFQDYEKRPFSGKYEIIMVARK